MWTFTHSLLALTFALYASGDQIRFELQYSMLENEQIGYRIGNLEQDLRKQDLMKFSSMCDESCKSLRYRLRESSAYVELDETTSLLSTNSIVDFEKLCVGPCSATLDAQLAVTVNIWNDKRIVAIVSVRIKVIDVDDNYVEFSPDIPRPFVLRLKEIIYGKDKTIELPRAIDLDITPQYSAISYRLHFTPDQWGANEMVKLQVSNDSRPVLILKQDLDYEKAKEYNFTLLAWNQESQPGGGRSKIFGKDTQLPISIQVLNINDMPPKFTQPVFSIEVAEDTQIGTSVFQLMANDEDADAEITYSLYRAPGMNLSLPFEVEPDGNVRLRESLDFEKRAKYSLPVRARDGEFEASAELHVQLLDVNDEAPTFIVNPTTIAVEENQPPNALVGHVVVRDADTLAVNGHLDCAEAPEDMERQPLRFARRTLSSASTNGVDQGLTHSTAATAAAVDELHFDLYTRHSLDREEGPPVRLSRLVCWDSASLGDANIYGRGRLHSGRSKTTTRLTSTLTVSIHVQDKNDNAPIFTQSSFTAELEENSAIRKEIIQLTSKDYDNDENAVTRYRLTDQNEDSSLFYLDEETGRIYAMTRFDRETRDTYILQVLAFDVSPNQLEIPNDYSRGVEDISASTTSTATVIVKIIDVNDNAPLIQESGELSLSENKEAGFLVGQVTATDLDAGVNGEVLFKLIPEDPQAVFNAPKMAEVMGFRMTSNGTIFSTRVFDREQQSRYCYQVQATDRSPDNPLTSTTRICINIHDVNDNVPIIHLIDGPSQSYKRDAVAQTPTFTRVESPYSLVSYDLPSLRTSINEAPGYCVLLMQAKDLDEGENAELRYSVHLSANCTHPSIFAPGYPEDTNYPGLEGLDVGGEGTEPIKSFRHSPFRMDERTGKLLLVRRFSSDEVGTYCLGLVVQDQGQPPQKSVQLIKLIVEDVPSRGTWLGVAAGAKGVANRDTSSSPRLEARNILIVIVLSTVSAFLAAVLISAILCMVRPFHKNGRGGRDASVATSRHGGGNSSTNGLKLPPFAMEPPTSPTLLMHARGGTLSPMSCSDSATLDGGSAIGDGAWILGPSGTLINPYDGSTLKDETLRIPADGLTSIWSPMTSSECAFETESLVPIGYTPEAFTSGTLQRSQPRHILLRQSPGVTVGTGVSSNCNILHHDVMELGVGGTAVEMVPISTVGGQEEQRSDSGRGASDEEAMFQTAFQPILCGVQTANGIKIAVPTDQNGYIGSVQRLGSNLSHITPTTSSGIYLCASSLGGQTSKAAASIASTSIGMSNAEDKRFVSTFVTNGKDTSSLRRGVYSNDGEASHQSISSAMQGNLNKTFSLPREGLCMTKSLLDEHTADESANRICNEIDHLLFENMI